MKSSKIVRGNFNNYFTDTPGIEEYGKYVDHLIINQDRMLVTNDEVFIIGNSKEATFKGFGGRVFKVWNTDGTISEFDDLWRLQDRTNEQVNVIKMENLYNPTSEENLRIYFYRKDIKMNDCIFICLPWKLKSSLITNKIQFIKKEDAVQLCYKNINETDKFDTILYKNIAKQISDSTKLYCVFVSNGESADSDYSILKLIYDGNTNYDSYQNLLMKSSWQWNMSPFTDILSTIKENYLNNCINKLNKTIFWENILSAKFRLNN